MYLAKMVLYLIFLVLNSSLNTNVRAEQHTQLETCTEGRYWRYYTGCIPKDALPGGTDKEGRPTYIGRTIHSLADDILVPGEFDPTTKTLSYEMNVAAHTTHKHIEILCVERSEQYEWINSGLVHNKEYLVEGGYKKIHNDTYFIGRAEADGRLIVGYLFSYDDTFYYVANGAAGSKKDNFQILSYNPKAPIRIVRKDSECGQKIINIHVN